jgi:hypothetical protein
MPWDPRRGTRIRSEIAESMKEEGLRTESSLASELKVDHKSLAAYRRGYLRENYHWELRNSTVYYNRIGMEQVKARIDVLEPEKEQAETREVRIYFGPDMKEPMRPGLVEIVRKPLNPRMLSCRDHLANRVTIFVRNTEKFRIGMKIDVEKQCKKCWRVQYPDGRRIYDFTGRYPRAYGRW